MTRIASLPVDQWDPQLRELAQADTLPPVQQTMLGVYANAPNLAKPFVIFSGAMSQGLTLRRRLLELVRLRIAFHNQCRSCMAVRYESALDDGLTEELVCSLEKPMEAPDLTDAQKAQVQTILDEQHAKMKAQHDAAQASGQKPTFEQMKAAHDQLQQETLAKLTPVLTPAQLKKFQILMEERGPPGGPHGPH